MTAQICILAESRFPINRTRIRETIGRFLERHRVQGAVEVEVVVAGDRKMRQLNVRYRNSDETASILSFALEDPRATVAFISPPDKILRLGSIVISYPQVVAQAADEGVMVDEKIGQLVEHGMRNLLGIDNDVK